MAGGDERAGLGDSNWCSAELSRLASIDYERRFRELLTTAQRANVSIHPVDTGGLRVSGGSTDMLRTLAERLFNEAVKETAYHINSFWEPRMRRLLFAHLDKGGEGLDPLVKDAAAKIKRPAAEAA